MSQIATTIEQSKRLIEAGLDPESCDMWWTIRRPLKYDGWKLVYNGEPCVPLQSLTMPSTLSNTNCAIPIIDSRRVSSSK